MKLRQTLAALAACLVAAGGALARMPAEINLAYVKAPFNLQCMVIKERKLMEKAFEKDGVKIRWRTITSGAQQAQAMAGDVLDVSEVMNTASILMGNGAGIPIRIATGAAHPADTFAIVAAKDGPKSIRELKGKKVAGPRGTVLHQTLVAALLREGMTPEDVEFVPMGIPAALAAVTSGNVSAAMVAASAVIKAEAAGCQVLTTARGLVNVNLVTTVRKSFYDDYPEAVERIVAVQREALRWIRSHWNEAVWIGAKEHGISFGEAGRLASWSNYYDTLTEEDINGLEADQEFLVKNGMMIKPVNVREIVLPTALR